jgi:hypothetical protein
MVFGNGQFLTWSSAGRASRLCRWDGRWGKKIVLDIERRFERKVARVAQLVEHPDFVVGMVGGAIN